MKITGNGKEVLKRTERDAYNCRYRVGSEVFRGYFYVSHLYNVLEFTLDNNREAIVFSETVTYICTGLQQHYDQCEDVDVLKLNEQEHFLHFIVLTLLNFLLGNTFSIIGISTKKVLHALLSHKK